MRKVFIRGDKIDDNNIRVTFQHFAPLDSKEGLTPNQLAEGYLVDSIPDPAPDKLKSARPILYYNIPENKCYWEYEEVKKSITIEDVNDKVDLLMQMVLESEGLL